MAKLPKADQPPPAPRTAGTRTVNLPGRFRDDGSLSPAALEGMTRKQLVTYLTRHDAKAKKAKGGAPNDTQNPKASKNKKRKFRS